MVETGEDPLSNSNLTSEQELYKENILDHYKHPRNKHEIKDPSCTHTSKNPLCGDEITVQLRITGGSVSEVGFSGSGCAISQASMSILSDEMKGKNIDDVLSMGQDDIVELLGIPIGVVRMKCAMLGLRVTQEAIKKKTVDERNG